MRLFKRKQRLPKGLETTLKNIPDCAWLPVSRIDRRGRVYVLVDALDGEAVTEHYTHMKFRVMGVCASGIPEAGDVRRRK